MTIDFSSLANAIVQLKTSLAYAHSEAAQNDAGLFEQMRNSVIQCFEFTYELSHKMLKRFLESRAANSNELNEASFQSMIRIGNEQGLLRSDWGRWRVYRQARNDSSHTYNAGKALAVYAIASEFLQEAQFLLAQLQTRQDADE